MNLVLGIICLWLGSAMLWVAGHGVDSAKGGFGAIWDVILAGIGGQG